MNSNIHAGRVRVVCGCHASAEFVGGESVSEKIAVISPEGLSQEGARNISRHLDSLDGKTIGEVYNNHFKGELMFRTYRSQFSKKFKNVKVIPFDEFPIVYVGGDPESQKKVAKQVAALAKERGCHALITGNGG
jgi:hypothetical protein